MHCASTGQTHVSENDGAQAEHAAHAVILPTIEGNRGTSAPVAFFLSFSNHTNKTMQKRRKRIDLLRLRKRHALVNAYLCRARRLFYAMYYRDIVRFIGYGDKAEERMVALGCRLRNRGFYAKTTSRLELGLAVVRAMAREREKRLGDQTLWRIKRESRIPLAVYHLQAVKA
jgi:hypothetical protein